MTLKILVSGSVDGNFRQFYERVNKANKKAGPFDMIIVVGNFFSDLVSSNEEWIDKAKRATLNIPNIPTYILGPSSVEQIPLYVSTSGDNDLDSGFEIADEMIYLGKKGILKGSSGLRIVYLSGTEAHSVGSKDTATVNFTKADIDQLKTQINASPAQVDILVTSQAPKGFSNGLGILPPAVQKFSDTGSELISSLAVATKPRYHFTAAPDFFFERHPYRNHEVLKEKTKTVTRLICLGPCNKDSKPKYLYAFVIEPACRMSNKDLVGQPGDVTSCPYTSLVAKLESDIKAKEPVAINNIFYSNSVESDEQPPEKRRRPNNRQNRTRQTGQKDTSGESNQCEKQEKNGKTEDDNCWFCLSSPKVDKSLIVSIGDYWYLASDKGPLVNEHLLLIPISHQRCIAELSDQEDVLSEMNKFIDALEKYFNSKGEIGVYVERNFKSFHLQLQVIPIPRYKAKVCSEIALDISKSHNLTMETIDYDKNYKDFTNPNSPYFLMSIPSIKFKGIVRINVKQAFFPLQLHRMIIADRKVLNVPNKIDWKRCTLESDEAVEHTKIIRENFKPYDFTLL